MADEKINITVQTQSDDTHPICLRCHRKLRSPEAIERGMGKVCWIKSQQKLKQTKLFDVEVNDGISTV